jgi:hypothetical protein
VSNTNENTQAFAPGEESVPDADITMPLGTGAFADSGAAEGVPGAATGRKFNSSALLIVLILGVAGVGLFTMRTLTRMTKSAVADIKVEKTVEEFIKERGGDLDPTRLIGIEENGVLQALREDRTELQVELADVQKDPFEIVTDRAPSDPVDPGDEDPTATRREERRVEILRLGEKMSLKSVIMGRDPLANISGRIVRVNEVITIEPEMVNFRVTSIEPDTVKLQCEEPELELTVDIELTLKTE